MKNLAFLCLIIICLSPSLHSQSLLQETFAPLLNKTWKAEAVWGNGGKFKQEVTFETALDGKIILAKSKGYTNQEQTAYGWRNFGIRKFDTAGESIRFWEFDVFGGLTEGEVMPKGKDLFYQYNYGGTELTDCWQYVNDSTYNFIVGVYENEEWKQTYLETIFRAKNVLPGLPDVQKLLTGRWSSKAWDGVLNETWSTGADGHIRQTSRYIENGKVLYEASSKMETVGADFILFTVIKGNNPKIFKMVEYGENEVKFENTDYKNPSVVIYKFVSANEYHRTIIGVENDAPTTYTFEFKREE